MKNLVTVTTSRVACVLFTIHTEAGIEPHAVKVAVATTPDDGAVQSEIEKVLFALPFAKSIELWDWAYPGDKWTKYTWGIFNNLTQSNAEAA